MFDSLSLGKENNPSHSWAMFTGKASYLEPDWHKAKSGYATTLHVEDRKIRGSGADRVWVSVQDGMSMAFEAKASATTIQGGDIVVKIRR
jgi:hypothetical protein